MKNCTREYILTGIPCLKMVSIDRFIQEQCPNYV